MSSALHSRPASARLPWLCAAVVLAATGLVYASAVRRGAFQYDDLPTIVDNPSIRSLTQVPRYFVDPGAFSGLGWARMYRPLVLASYAGNYALGGDDPRGYHLVNALVHGANGVLVCLLVARLGGGAGVGLVAALLFVVHPVNTEAAAYVSSRSESLCALFLLASLLAWLRAGDAGAGAALRPLAAAAFAMALLCKSVAIALPALLLAHDLLVRRQAWGPALWRRHAPFWALAAGYAALVSGQIGQALVTAPVRGPAAQLWTQLKAVPYYARLLWLPRGLNVEHQFAVAAHPWDPAVLAAAAAVASGVAVALSCRGAKAFWLCWGPAVLLQTAVVPLNILVNERRLYLATVAAAALAATAFWRAPAHRRAVRVAGVAAIACLGLLAQQRAALWSDAEALWSDALHKAPGMPRPHLFMGDAHARAGRFAAALAEYDAAQGVNPAQLSAGDQLALYNNRGATLLAVGRFADAAASYARALRIDSTYAPARAGLEGLRATQSGAGRDPRSAALAQAGMAALVRGDLAGAVASLRSSLAIQSDEQTWLALGLAWERLQRWDEAAAAYRQLEGAARREEYARAARQRLQALPGGSGS